MSLKHICICFLEVNIYYIIYMQWKWNNDNGLIISFSDDNCVHKYIISFLIISLSYDFAQTFCILILFISFSVDNSVRKLCISIKISSLSDDNFCTQVLFFHFDQFTFWWWFCTQLLHFHFDQFTFWWWFCTQLLHFHFVQFTFWW